MSSRWGRGTCFSLICFILVTFETFQIRDVNIIRLCCLQLERCSSRDSEELWPLELMYSDIFHIVFILIQGAHTHTHTCCCWHEQKHTHTHTHTSASARWPWLVSSVISIWSCSCWWSPFITRLSYTAGLAPLLTSTHLTLSLWLSVLSFPLIFLSSPLLSRFLLDLALFHFFFHLPLYLTPSFLLFFLPPSSLCRVYLPRFVHVRDADQDVRSGHPALLPLLIQLLRLCGECAHTHTHTHTHTHSNWVKKQIMPVTIRFWWRTQRSI